MKHELQTAREDLRAAYEHSAANEDMVTALQEKLQEKEARVAHLETCKLTKEQMKRIQVVKEERKKFQDDSRILKKQLYQLTIKFDELKESAKQLSESRANGVVGGGPSTDYIISDLRVQLVTTTQQLSQAQDEVKLLKSKLKECAVQLKVRDFSVIVFFPVLPSLGTSCTMVLTCCHLSGVSPLHNRSTRLTTAAWSRCWRSTAWTPAA
jgi:hypothetical protein